jgi:hypothetical protein
MFTRQFNDFNGPAVTKCYRNSTAVNLTPPPIELLGGWSFPQGEGRIDVLYADTYAYRSGPNLALCQSRIRPHRASV